MTRPCGSYPSLCDCFTLFSVSFATLFFHRELNFFQYNPLNIGNSTTRKATTHSSALANTTSKEPRQKTYRH